MGANLALYQAETLDLMRDSNGQFTSATSLNRYINGARRQISMRSGCLEANVTGQAAFGTGAQPGYAIPGAIVPGTLPGSFPNNFNEPGAVSTPTNQFTTIPGVEMYSYGYAKPFLQRQYSGYESVIYVSSIAVSWGGIMPTLDWMPFNDLQALARAANIGVTSYPSVWSQKGLGESGQVYVFPIPSSLAPGSMEWQCLCTPKALYTNDDFCALPEIYQNLVKYYAAYLGFLAQQRTGMAATMRGLFDEQLLISGVASDWGHVDSYYGGHNG